MGAIQIEWLAHLAYADRAVPLLRTMLELATPDSVPRLHRALEAASCDLINGARQRRATIAWRHSPNATPSCYCA